MLEGITRFSVNPIDGGNGIIEIPFGLIVVGLVVVVLIVFSVLHFKGVKIR